MDEARMIRDAGRDELALALVDSRERLLRVWAGYDRALAGQGWQVRELPELNPPLWELGHVPWFEEFWIGRNPLRHLGIAADPQTARAASALPRADGLYNSSLVPHARRWHLDLPSARRTLDYAAAVRERTLGLLAATPPDARWLYFFRLALHHEEMHREAWIHMAQTLGIALDAASQVGAPAASGVEGEWRVDAQTLTMGSADGGGFAFDNELGAHEVAVAGFSIDRSPVSWGRYLPFIDAGGYDDARWWSTEGWAWRQQQGLRRPRHLWPADGGGWTQNLFGRSLPVDPRAPAMHVSAHEAQAWCGWAGRRLPDEAEWEAAAALAAAPQAAADSAVSPVAADAAVSPVAADAAFDWGQVWEWTATAFAPYPGFTAHPYRDYSAPWFDGRPALRGASFATAPRLKHLRYRNYYPAERNDVFAGFRSCAARQA